MSVFVRVEGVNFANFVEDTQDLSTARGGSLILRDVISGAGLESVETWLRMMTPSDEATPNVRPISTGASAGLFRVEWPEGVSTPPSPADIVTNLQEKLAKHEQYKHATHVVSAAEAGDFATVKETLLAANRWEQMQAPSVAIPSATNATGPCDIDKVRPGDQTYNPPESTHLVPLTKPASLSVLVRREFGRSQKRGDFYRQEAADASGEAIDLHGIGFVNDLEALAGGAGHRLNGKVAVFYVDGNKFGKIQQRCLMPETLKAWDTSIKSLRRSWLRALLQKACADRPGWFAGDDIRLETLLWGGDEFMLVVPAWKGWETLAFFYRESAAWSHELESGRAIPLTHAAGLVFCHHKAPIQRVATLARSLAQCVKDQYDQGDQAHPDRRANRFSYQALESFDHIGRDLRAHQIDLLPRPATLTPGDQDESRLAHLCLAGSAADAATSAMACLRAEFPKGQLHQIIEGLRAGGSDREAARSDGALMLLKSLGGDPAKVDVLRGAFGKNDTFWLHVAELWDYIG